MSVQTILVLAAAALAVAYLARIAWRTWSAKGCAKGCGCGPKQEAAPKLIAPAELLARVRSAK